MEMVRLEPPAELTMSVGETMFTQRATRRLDPNRPVTDAQLELILNAASKAPNGGPRVQSGQYLVIRERNDIAEELEAFYIEQGGFLRREDLAAHQTLIEEPVSVYYKGYQVYKCGPWTQGPYLCQALRLLEGFDLKGMGHLSTNYVHVAIEALKLAMADRDEYYLSLIHISEPTRPRLISYAGFCLKK